MMNRFKHGTTLTCLMTALLLASISGLFADTKRVSAYASVPVEDLGGTIIALDEHAISIKDPQQAQHTYQLSSHTRCILDGREAFLSQLKTDYAVRLSSLDGHSASEIIARSSDQPLRVGK